MIERWLLSLFAVLGAFVFCGLGGAVLADVIEVWQTPVAGFCAAFAVVAVAYLSAPARAKGYALGIAVVGTVIACLILRDQVYPETYGELAYQTSWIPLISTIAGGLAALVIVLFPSAQKSVG